MTKITIAATFIGLSACFLGYAIGHVIIPEPLLYHTERTVIAPVDKGTYMMPPDFMKRKMRKDWYVAN